MKFRNKIVIVCRARKELYGVVCWEQKCLRSFQIELQSRCELFSAALGFVRKQEFEENKTKYIFDAISLRLNCNKMFYTVSLKPKVANRFRQTVQHGCF